MAKIYHNPACGTSRKVLAILEQAGGPVEVVEYLRTPPDAAALRALLAQLALPARGLLRAKEPAYREFGLQDPSLDDAALITAMVAHPILIERPVVITELGARLCRPAEKVLEILPAST